MGVLQRWFNVPPYKGAPCLIDKYGEKHWYGWWEREADISLDLRYRGRPSGIVDLFWNDDGGLTLADIFVPNRDNLRQRGIGKAMKQETVRWAKEKGAKYIWGFLVPHDGVTMEYLVEWYGRQGFQVTSKEDKRFIYLSLLQKETSRIVAS
jgi:GNAT superfamily N-acetyltransferase